MARFRLKPLLESEITATIREMLERLNARTIKICGGPYQENGIADLLVCLDGKFIAIEVKRPGCKPTPLQIKFLDEIRRAGGIAFIASSLEDVVRELGSKQNFIRYSSEADLMKIERIAERRTGIERRRFSYYFHIPERRMRHEDRREQKGEYHVELPGGYCFRNSVYSLDSLPRSREGKTDDTGEII